MEPFTSDSVPRGAKKRKQNFNIVPPSASEAANAVQSMPTKKNFNFKILTPPPPMQRFQRPAVHVAPEYEDPDPEVRKWAKEYQKNQEIEKAIKVNGHALFGNETKEECLQSEVKKLKRENEYLERKNVKLAQKIEDVISELKESKKKGAYRRYNSRSKTKKKQHDVEVVYDSSNSDIIENFWRRLEGDYGKEAAQKIIKHIHKKRIEKAQNSSDEATSDALLVIKKEDISEFEAV